MSRYVLFRVLVLGNHCRIIFNKERSTSLIVSKLIKIRVLKMISCLDL